ncbi:hypothetical protein SynPROSU1_01850 [Synechococcus sp. PROS-U-1]|nr:hypothetical protein SynPROSU1_01850 [Synechococcus sp. PROS-U-1]
MPGALRIPIARPLGTWPQAPRARRFDLPSAHDLMDDVMHKRAI